MPSHPATGPSPARGSPTLREMEPKDQQLMVALRIRPLNSTELEAGATVIAHKVGDQVVVLMDPEEDPEDTQRAHRSRERTFIFDTVFDQRASQEDVYCATIQHLVEGVISGYNATVFAYGPSGAGKTHTMLGMDAEPGIYLQTLTDLFQAIEESRGNMDYSVSMSYLEIYNEVIRDLLNPSSGFLDLREDSRGSIQIAGITEVSTSNAREIMQLLIKGNRQRTQEPTAANKTSSRSHAVLQVTVHQRSRGAALAEAVRLGRLFMVDLAGSERASQTQNRGQRMKEGAHINRSLLALGNCINALSEKGGRAHFVNFRDSKLTRLLKDALGGNSRTVMIAHISPASTSFEESRTTLLYAYRAKNIKTRVKRNLLNVSYHIAQYTDVISDLRREIEHLKSKIEKQDKKKNEPGILDVQVPIAPHDAEEDSHRQMNKIRAQLIGAFREQMAMRRSLVELENASTELHVDMSRHLLTVADWEREKTHHHVHTGGDGESEKEDREGDTEGEEGESVEPPEVALAREEVNLLLAEQRKTAALKARLEQRLAHAKQKVSRMEQLLPRQVTSEEQREVLRLLCRAHELEVENTELQADNLCRRNLLCQQDLVIQRYHQHRLLCQQVIQGQRQLIWDSGISVPESLEQQYQLYSRELGEGTLDRLLLLPSVMSSSLWDGSVPNRSPSPPEEPSGDQPDNRKDLPWGTPLELPPILLERDSDGNMSSKSTPLRKRGKQDALLPLPALRVLLTPPVLEQPSALGVKSLVSRLQPTIAQGPRPPQAVGEASSPAPSASALKEMALGTKSITLVAASRRRKGRDRDGGSLDSRDPSPAHRRWPQASPSRDCSGERKARRKRSPSFTCSLQLATERPKPPTEHSTESQLSPAYLQPAKSPGKGMFPAVPVASKMKPSPSFRTDENTLQVPEVSFTFPSAVWRGSTSTSHPPLLPRDFRGSTGSGSWHHSPLPPSNPHKPQGGSAKRPRQPK
uniref:kinesin-like protein KIF19 n=1 Tax=Jaculus jaculus TaxID=51337 RepID=UPI001E1B3E77|nr:kinesin-like protein KIF19 [Jaculus jaculus]